MIAVNNSLLCNSLYQSSILSSLFHNEHLKFEVIQGCFVSSSILVMFLLVNKQFSRENIITSVDIRLRATDFLLQGQDRDKAILIL